MNTISFSLWGDNPKYTIGMIENVKLAKVVYPGWMCRIYCGEDVDSDVLESLIKTDKVDVVMMKQCGKWNGMFWRFLPASDARVNVMVCRDCDSRISLREKLAVDEWLVSDKSFHIMRDHPHHSTLILGGMWGVKFPKLKDIDKMISTYDVVGNVRQIDQNFLRTEIYPLIKNDCMIHDEILRYENSLCRKFPNDRNGLEFVGQQFDINNVPDKKLEEALERTLKKR